jgi:integrase
MSDKTWNDVPGMYTRVPTRGQFKGSRVLCGRVWVQAHGRFRHFILGTELKKSTNRLREIQLDPLVAGEGKKRAAVKRLTFGAVLDAFLKGYRTRGRDRPPRAAAQGRGRVLRREGRQRDRLGGVDRYLAMRRSLRRKKDGERKVSECSLKKEITSIGTMYRWARRRALVPSNPVAEYEKPKEPNGRVKTVLTSEQEAALQGKCAPWLWAVVEWALYCPMRIGEILALEWRAVDRTAQVIHVEGMKTTTRSIPLNLSRRLTDVLARRRAQMEAD